MAWVRELPVSQAFLRQAALDFSEVESSAPLCRHAGCHLESTFSTDVIMQYLKRNSKTLTQDGIPSGLWKVYCLATSIYCSEFFWLLLQVYLQTSLSGFFWFFLFFLPISYINKQIRKTPNPRAALECMATTMAPHPKSWLQPCIPHYTLSYKKTDIFCKAQLSMPNWILSSYIHSLFMILYLLK